MRYWLSFALFASVSITAQSLTVSVADLGEMTQFTTKQAEVLLTNNTDKVVKVHAIPPAREGDSIATQELTMQPHEERAINIVVNSRSDIGKVLHSFEFAVEGQEAKAVAQAHLFVTSILDDPRPKLDFGNVRSDEAMSNKVVGPFTSEKGPLKIERIISAPEFVDATFVEDADIVSVTLKGQRFWGHRTGTLKVALASKDQSQVWIDVNADIVGDISANSDPYNLGVIRAGSPHDFLIELRSRKKKENVRVGSLNIENLNARVAAVPCVPDVLSCKLIRLTMSPEQKPGAIRGMIYAELPDVGLTLPIHVGGMIISKDATIPSLDEEIKKNAERAKSQSSSAPKVDVSKALAAATNEQVAPRVVDAEPGMGPLLTWVIANGQALHGFTIWRGPTDNGPFERVNKSTVKAIQEKQEVTYKFRDNTAKSGETYWYYIGLVYEDGHKQQLTGPQKVVAK